MNATRLADRLVEYDSTVQPHRTRLRQAISLVSLVLAAWHLVRAVAVRLLEEELNERGQCPDGGQQCPVCGRFMENKGFKVRRMLTFLGWVSWRRRIRTCSPACAIGQIVPSDEALEIVPYQQTSWEVQRLACLLAVVVPCALARDVLSQVTGVSVCPKTFWNWVQDWGALAMEQMQEHLTALAAGEAPREDAISAEEHALPLLLGADGVMVPFRPEAGTAQGKTRWREVKVGILARLTRTVSHTGKPVCRLVRRRLVAV